MKIVYILLLIASILPYCAPQARKIIGDISEQKVSVVADIDERNEQIYRRPATYLILASKIVRPDSIYQVVAALYEHAVPMRIKASLAKNGVEVFGSDEFLNPTESKSILLQVPPGNDYSANYRLKIEGYGQQGGAMVFQNETQLEFSARFLTIMISTNKVAYSAVQTMRIRAVLLRTDLLPFEDVADLFIIDPDGFIIRKWNSKHLNSGVLTQKFEIPEFPKVGFWTIRVAAQGQVQDKKIKIEKYYIPMFETFVRMPSFHFSDDEGIEVNVNTEYTFDKLGYSDVILRWYAKPTDHASHLFNDTVFYRQEYEYYYKQQNFHSNSLYENKDGIPYRNLSLIQHPDRYGYEDPYVNVTGKPYIPKVHNWTYIRSDIFKHRAQAPQLEKYFYISMQEISQIMKKVEGLDVMAEAFATDFFYNNTQRGWCITRIINKTLELKFLGQSPQVFKPGMLFETQVSIKYIDQVPLDQEKLESSTLSIEARAQLNDGSTIELERINIPKKLSQICSEAQDIDRLKHYGQSFGNEAASDSQGSEINPAYFFGEDIEENTEFCIQLLAKESLYQEFREKGVHNIRLWTPKNAKKIDLTAVYKDPDSDLIFAKLPVHAAYAPQENYIHVRSSTKRIEVGQYVVFHVSMSNLLTYFDWIILSKNMIINRGREYSEDFFTYSGTFSLIVNAEMAPGFHILVYTKTDQDYLIADSNFYPVKSINRHDIQFSLTQLKDHTMHTVEATCRGDPGSYFGVTSQRQFLLGSQGSNVITYANVMDSLYTFENRNHHVHRIFWTDREGEVPDRVAYYASQDYGIDSNRTIALQDLLVFTDFVAIPRTPQTRQCDESKGYFPCMITGCFEADQKCDGNEDCTDGYDEFNCGDKSVIDQELVKRYRFSRFNRYDDFYDNWDGDWGWFDVNIDEDREQFETIEVPETADDWFLNAFSVSKKYGLTIAEPLVEYTTNRPIFLYCEGPAKVKRGETIGIRCTVFNWTPIDVEVVLMLKDSEDYEFVHVEEYGYVTAFNPRTSSGDHHHFIFLRGDWNMDVHFPIRPKIDIGTIEAVITLNTQIISLEQRVEVEIVGEGSKVHKHTSAVLDLKTRAFELEFFNIIVDQDPVVPYEIYRRFISGSPVGSVILSGDAIGPTFRNDEPVNMYTMFPTVQARCGKGTEYHLFNLAANTWFLHYLRLTNQLTEKGLEFQRKIFEAMNVELTAVMRRFRSFGAISLFDNSSPSVWLTAWTINIFEDVAFQDWEDYIYIDPEIFQNSVMWLINYQHQDGYFTETENQQAPILKHLQDWSSNGNVTSKVSLTAHVLIAMDKTAPALTGDVRKFGSRSRLRAQRYLEKKIDSIRDPYEMALTAYALTRTNSPEADYAYDRLYNMRREESALVYWSRNKIWTNNITYEFTQPFVNPKNHQIDDALAVETTSYALLTMFIREGGGITFEQNQIIKWLNTMRLGAGGFISTVDTVVALEALVRYSYHNNIKDLTDLFITVNLPDSNFKETFNIKSEGVSNAIEVPISSVWGNLFMEAKGRGQAVAQMDIMYGVDYPTYAEVPPKKCFDLKFKEYLAGRNKSEVSYNTCFKWTCTDESEQSGFAMLVLDIPSGYILLQPDANKIVRSGVIPQMKDCDMEQPGKSIWYFDFIPSYQQCFRHTVRRYFPVANMSRTRQVMLVEPYRPERFVIKSFNSTSLYILSVCEVCGSYQCPYCPFYSEVPGLVASSILITALTTFILVINSTI